MFPLKWKQKRKNSAHLFRSTFLAVYHTSQDLKVIWWGHKLNCYEARDITRKQRFTQKLKVLHFVIYSPYR